MSGRGRDLFPLLFRELLPKIKMVHDMGRICCLRIKIVLTGVCKENDIAWNSPYQECTGNVTSLLLMFANCRDCVGVHFPCDRFPLMVTQYSVHVVPQFFLRSIPVIVWLEGHLIVKHPSENGKKAAGGEEKKDRSALKSSRRAHMARFGSRIHHVLGEEIVVADIRRRLPVIATTIVYSDHQLPTWVVGIDVL